MHYTLSVKLKDRTPVNHRTLQVADTVSFATLAQTICELYGLTGEHLREFLQKDKLCINHPEVDVSTLDSLDPTDPDVAEILEESTQKQVSSTTYLLRDYFSTENKIVFSYDFGTPRVFLIEKTAQADLPAGTKEIILLAGKGTYLVEDSGGATGLQEYLDDYKRHKRDEDRRESREEFDERLCPAMRKFEKKNHPELS